MSNGCGYTLSVLVSTLLTQMQGSLPCNESRRFTSLLPTSMWDMEGDETDPKYVYSNRNRGSLVHIGGIELALQPRDIFGCGGMYAHVIGHRKWHFYISKPLMKIVIIT